MICKDMKCHLRAYMYPILFLRGRDDEDEAIQVVVHWGEWGLLDGDVIGHSIVDYPEDRQY